MRRSSEKRDAKKRDNLTPKEREAFMLGYRSGIRAAAQIANQWRVYLPIKYVFEDVILAKFNLIGKDEMRKKG